jgi:enoyl-CoA hydratase/carnithine racemase
MQVELADGVTTVRIDHPPVHAFDLGLVDDAIATVRGIQGPIVLTGAGTCFSAGLVARAVATARALGQHSPAAYSAMKEQLPRPAREAIDAGAELDANVQALWKSEETRARISAFLDALK